MTIRHTTGAYYLLVSAMLLGSAGGQTAADDIAASGTFRPAGPPDQPVRSPIGNSCIVDIEQGYVVDGTLSGTWRIDFRIYVAGPCGSPPGTYREHWIARGRYSVEVDGTKLEGPLIYLADVEAGGDVTGNIALADGLTGSLEVRGRFQDGFMRYQGRLTREPSR